MIHYDFRTTGLVVFDMLEAYREPIEAAGSIGPTTRLIQACRAVGVPIFYARADHRADGADFARTLADTDNQFRPWGPDNPYRTVPPTRPARQAGGSRRDRTPARRLRRPEASLVGVSRHHLELSLRSRDIDTILLVGGSVHVGIASTAYDARDMDFQITVVPECCHGFPEQREFFMTKVFPRMCNVRALDDVIRGLTPQRDNATTRVLPEVGGHTRLAASGQGV